MEYTLKLTQQQVQLLMVALGDVPLKHSLGTFTSIEKQVAEQDEKNALKLKGAK